MAFLDNSGDIILDAVLTDKGRRAMANGNFKISKFALGDDEINYSQYQLNHPSGSAYSDLEILQTPVLEGVTAESSAINYGLLSLTKLNILYLPSLKVNQTMSSTQAVAMSGNIFHLAVNGETANRLKGVVSSGIYGLGSNTEQMLEANSVSSRKIYFESGIDTTDEPADAASRAGLITSVGMLDSQFSVSMDMRFFSGMYELQAGQVFSAGTDSTSPAVIADQLEAVGSNPTVHPGLENFAQVLIRGLNNLLYSPADPTVRTDPSVLAGPRGTAAAINFKIKESMRKVASTGTPDAYIKHGKTSQVLFANSGGTDKYDYIDTTVYVRGKSSTAMMQLPIRILRYSGA